MEIDQLEELLDTEELEENHGTLLKVMVNSVKIRLLLGAFLADTSKMNRVVEAVKTVDSDIGSLKEEIDEDKEIKDAINKHLDNIENKMKTDSELDEAASSIYN